MLSGFKTFIMRGNVVDLAVGIVIGAAFTAVVNGLLNGLVNPFIAAIFGQTDISGVGEFTINKAEFSVGLFLDPLLKFIIVAAVLYFFVVMPMNTLAARRARGQEPEPEPVPEPDVVLLAEIRDLLAAEHGRR